MHDHHNHDDFSVVEPSQKWVVYFEREDGYWSCARVEADNSTKAIQTMMLTMPVKSPFRAWTFPVHPEAGLALTAEVIIQPLEEA